VAATGWVAENMTDIALKEARIGEILFSTTLGVTATAGVSA